MSEHMKTVDTAWILLDALRAWARRPGECGAFPVTVERRLVCAGLSAALVPLDGLMGVLLVHARHPVDFAPVGTPDAGTDERVMLRLFLSALAGVPVNMEPLRDWVSPQAWPLVRRAVERLVTAMTCPVARGALPVADIVTFPVDRTSAARPAARTGAARYADAAE